MLLDDIEEIFSVRIKIWLDVYSNESYAVLREDLIDKNIEEKNINILLAIMEREIPCT